MDPDEQIEFYRPVQSAYDLLRSMKPKQTWVRRFKRPLQWRLREARTRRWMARQEEEQKELWRRNILLFGPRYRPGLIPKIAVDRYGMLHHVGYTWQPNDKVWRRKIIGLYHWLERHRRLMLAQGRTV